MDVLDRCSKCGIVPVVVIHDEKDAVPTAEALLAGGVDVMEITMRTSAGLESIRRVSETCKEMLVGAGTVITLDQCKDCVRAGAEFIVSPGFDPEVVAWCLEQGVPVLPGCVTPSEIMAAMKLGIRTMKFFPANVYGGLKAIKSLGGPFVGITFVPTGGANADNLKEFILSPLIRAVGGSWMCTAADIAAGRFDRITGLCREAREIIDSARAEAAS